jgi:hypothetical protein
MRQEFSGERITVPVPNYVRNDRISYFGPLRLG